ncbi:MAG: PrsW family intramembrane metalloprotease [Brooklawnia sp.]
MRLDPDDIALCTDCKTCWQELKGAFLFWMLTGARRRQMRTLVDHLVYAGFVGFGFAFVENLLYFASAQTLSDTIFMAIVRTGFNLFGHSFYTSAIAVGIYLGRRHQGSTRALYYIAGYVAAVLLHSLWNGAATLLGGIGLITVYFLILTPAFIALVRQGIKARNREGQVIAAQLPLMAHQGLVPHQEAQWISALPNRAAMRRQLKGQDAQLARARNLVEAVAELAVIRDRSLGEPSLFEEQEEAYLVQAILAERHWLPGGGFGWQGPGQGPGGTVPPGPYPPNAGYPTGGGFGR